MFFLRISQVLSAYLRHDHLVHHFPAFQNIYHHFSWCWPMFHRFSGYFELLTFVFTASNSIFQHVLLIPPRMVFLWLSHFSHGFPMGFPWFLVGLSYGFSHVVFPSSFPAFFVEEFIQLATHLRSNRHVSLDLPGYRRALCHRAGGAGFFSEEVCWCLFRMYIYIYM